MKIHVETTVSAPLARVWEAYTTPAEIVQWNFASDDWHCPSASGELREGGKFSSRMEAKDGSFGFDFEGTYTKIETHKRIEYAFGDRSARVTFAEGADGATVGVDFDTEDENSADMQRDGWQAVLNNFKSTSNPENNEKNTCPSHGRSTLSPHINSPKKENTMTTLNTTNALVLERVVDVPPAKVYEAWTTPEILMKWFCPDPWKVTACEIDLVPGGAFNTTMQGPDGQAFPNSGCVLEVIPGRKLVFTDTLLPGYRPAENPFMTAIVEIIPEGTGTRYRATALHKDEETKKKHEEMGFHEGWATALDQMVAVIQGKRG